MADTDDDNDRHGNLKILEMVKKAFHFQADPNKVLA